jgi:hypothetical protein
MSAPPVNILPPISSSSTQSGLTPARSAEQRRQALAQANAVRTERAQLTADLKRGAVSLAALIAEAPPCLASAKVTDVLCALRDTGRSRPPACSSAAR